MKWLGVGLMILGMLFGVASSGETGNPGQYARTPEETGILLLRGLRIEGGTVHLTVATRGCTTKEDVVVQVVEKESRATARPITSSRFCGKPLIPVRGSCGKSSLCTTLRMTCTLSFPACFR